MQTAATSLRAILEIVEREASAMAEVQQRNAAKKPAPRELSRVAALPKHDPLPGSGFGVFVGGIFKLPRRNTA